MTTKAKFRPTKDYPFTSAGVNENANLRMLKMAVPTCPIPTTFSPVGSAGLTRAKFDEMYPELIGQESCQSGRYRAGWWNDCEAKGHNPYFYSRRRTVTSNTFDENGVLTGQTQRLVSEEGPNITQVAIAVRHNAGHEVLDVKERGGKELEELGYAPRCEMRNCENEVKLSCRFGRFCSERHARLIAADFKGVFLAVQPDTELSKWQEEREEQLASIELGKVTYA